MLPTPTPSLVLTTTNPYITHAQAQAAYFFLRHDVRTLYEYALCGVDGQRFWHQDGKSQGEDDETVASDVMVAFEECNTIEEHSNSQNAYQLTNYGKLSDMTDVLVRHVSRIVQSVLGALPPGVYQARAQWINPTTAYVSFLVVTTE